MKKKLYSKSMYSNLRECILSCACLVFLTGKYEQNVHVATFAVVRACLQIMPMSFIFSSLYGICVLPPMLRNPFICFLRACCLSAYRPSVWIFTRAYAVVFSDLSRGFISSLSALRELRTKILSINVYNATAYT